MIINKNSWHYKVLTRKFIILGIWEPSRSLCVYFWQVVLKLTMCFLQVLLPLSPLVPITLFFIEWSNPPIIISILTLLGLSVGIVILLFGTVRALVFLAELVVFLKRKYLGNSTATIKPKEPSILLNYIKAKKEKVCPLLTFED